MSGITLYDTVGFIGPVSFLWAYMMIALGYWTGEQLRTHVLNLLGAVAILISMMGAWNLPVFVLEICWSAISVYGIWRALRARAKNDLV
jgi:paired small multidrug resistance pump